MTRYLHAAGVHVALAAMLLRALLPSGWMPNPTPGSGSLLTICTMSGLVTVKQPLDSRTKKGGPSHDAHHHDVCPFAAAAHLARSDGAGFVLVGPVGLHRVTVPAPAIIRGRIAFRPYSPRGPPLLREV